jgi:hypothetical protein
MSDLQAVMASVSGELEKPASFSVTSTGSTTARSLADRFGEVFHVDDYGAKGDWNGSTGTDDTAAIQAAINAAVAAGGGIVRFGANKKYRLNTRSNRNTDTIGFNANNQRHFLRVGSGNLTSNFGSTSMMLYFEGNGATLHATEYSTNSNDIIYVCCQFHTIVFSDLKFTRNPYQITATGNQTKALAFYAADSNEHEQVLIQNCYFNDNMASIDFSIWSPTTNWRDTIGKCKKVDVINCIFEYPNGTSRIANKYTSGALVVYMCPWVLSANFEGCHADGQNNGQTSLTYDEPMHGFLFPMPIRASVNNCYFTHFCVEVIKASDEETSQTNITISGNFTQVTVGDPLSRTIASNNNSSLIVGKVYCFFDPSVYASKRGGFFRLEPKTGGGEYEFSVGETLNFTRVSSEPYQIISSREIQAGQSFGSNNIKLLDMDLLDSLSLDVNNCIFDSKPLKDYTGADLTGFGSPMWDNPSILCDYRCSVINNKFYGGHSNFYSNVSSGNFLPTIIANNLFYKYTHRDEQIDGRFISCFSRKSNVTIVNNSFVARETRAVTYFIFAGGHEILIRGNTAIVLNPSSLDNNGVTLPTWFVAYDNGGLYRVVSEDNHLKDLENYGSSNDVGNVAHFIGSIRGQVQKPAYPSNPNAWARPASQPFRMAKLFKSQDGSTWTVGVTNDGELEVIK